MKYCLIPLLLISCENMNFNLTNTGTIGQGDTKGNVSTVTVTQENRELTKEEIKRAKKGYEAGKRDFLKYQASIDVLESAVKVEYESDISRADYLKKFKVLGESSAHRDLITILHLSYRKVTDFNIFEVDRSLKAQKANVKKGVSTTVKGSRHLARPTQAADIRSTRKAKPFVNGKKDIYDVEMLGYIQATAEGFGMVLSNYPCEVFASKVRRVFRWKTIRDLFHIEVNPRRECKAGYRESFNAFLRKVTYWYKVGVRRGKET